MSFLHFGKMPETPPQSHFLPKTPSGDCPGLAGESGARPAGPCGLPRVPLAMPLTFLGPGSWPPREPLNPCDADGPPAALLLP